MKSKNNGFTILRLHSGFTIVELLVVIVVIGILAAITIVSYSGIRQRANLATLQSDLKNASTQLEVAHIENDAYPDQSSVNLKSSLGTILTYTRNGASSYCLQGANNGVVYHIDSTNKTIISGLCVSDWITIGAQTWAKKNLNVGTLIPGTTEQSNTGTVEKYCYNNDEANCTIYGGLYQWNEAMQYATTERAQGICPSGSHIPSDTEWKALEMQLGMTQVQADSTGQRGTDQGTQLKSGGSSGLNILFSGYRHSNGSFYLLDEAGLVMSSSQSGSAIWERLFDPSYATVTRDMPLKVMGLSVRCLID